MFSTNALCKYTDQYNYSTWIFREVVYSLVCFWDYHYSVNKNIYTLESSIADCYIFLPSFIFYADSVADYYIFIAMLFYFYADTVSPYFSLVIITRLCKRFKY